MKWTPAPEAFMIVTEAAATGLPVLSFTLPFTFAGFCAMAGMAKERMSVSNRVLMRNRIIF